MRWDNDAVPSQPRLSLRPWVRPDWKRTLSHVPLEFFHPLRGRGEGLDLNLLLTHRADKPSSFG